MQFKKGHEVPTEWREAIGKAHQNVKESIETRRKDVEAQKSRWKKIHLEIFDKYLSKGVKKCPMCKIVKPTSEFRKHKACWDGLGWQCKECRNIYDHAQYLKHRDKRRVQNKEWGKRPEVMKRRRERQRKERIVALTLLGGRCLKCGTTDIRILEVHNHKTNNSSLLCGNCHNLEHWLDRYGDEKI